MRILVVEDEAILAMDIMSNLVEWGYEAVCAICSGEEAINRVQKEKPDLVLMDITLSGVMNGLDAATIINAKFKIPIVFLTANNDIGMIKRGKDAGAFGFLAKPYDSLTLRSTIEMAHGRALDMAEIRRLNAELQNSLDKIEVFRQHIPICVWCKQIHLKDGSWEHVDKYLMANSPIEFSQCVCPVCHKSIRNNK